MHLAEKFVVNMFMKPGVVTNYLTKWLGESWFQAFQFAWIMQLPLNALNFCRQKKSHQKIPSTKLHTALTQHIRADVGFRHFEMSDSLYLHLISKFQFRHIYFGHFNDKSNGTWDKEIFSVQKQHHNSNTQKFYIFQTQPHRVPYETAK